MKAQAFTLPDMAQLDFTVNFVEDIRHNQLSPHIHKECEIYVNLSGDVSFEVEGRIYPITRGCVVITRPYEYHRCIYHSELIHNHFWITFSARQSEDFLQRFYRREKGCDNLILLDEPQLDELCDVLFGLLKSNSDSLRQRIGVLTIFYILENGKRSDDTGTWENLPQDVVNTLLYMDEHITEDIDIRAAAERCGVSINTLERHFRQALAVSPTEALRKKRLFLSMQYLRQGETVANAALKSGFPDYSNYIQLFKKQFGMTPLKYKRAFHAGVLQYKL